MQQKLVHEIPFPLVNEVYDIANHDFEPSHMRKEKKLNNLFLLLVLSGQHTFSCSLLWLVFLSVCLSMSLSLIACTL
jgi:hypothetical protein